MIKFDDVDAGMVLVATDEIAKEYPECFMEGDKIHIFKNPHQRKDMCGLVLSCRTGGLHELEEYVIFDENGTAVVIGFDLILN